MQPNNVFLRWLKQAKTDPSISQKQLAAWASNLETQLQQAVTRYDYAKLFGDLLGEWLQSGDSLATSGEAEKGRPESVRQGQFHLTVAACRLLLL